MHARRLAIGTLAQQLAQVVGVVVMLAVVTALGRTLTLTEFGVYGLTLSFVNYLLFIQGSVVATTLKSLSEARTDRERDRAFTASFAVLSIFGAGAGIVLAVGGLALLQAFTIPHSLRSQARIGIVVLGLITATSWPIRTFPELLRARQRFALAAFTETGAYLAFGATMLVLALAVHPPLWILISVGGTLPLSIGVLAAVTVFLVRDPVRLRISSLDRAYVRGFVSFSGYLFATGASDVVITQLDRTILAAFRTAATVGLYEAAVRPSNLVRQLHGMLVRTVMPATSSFLAQGDTARVRQLLVRGTRYVLAASLPFTIVFIVLSDPILRVWLGPRYQGAATALSILAAWWILGANTGVAGSMLTAAGRVRPLVAYAWSVAAINLVLALTLTPIVGLPGVVIGTTGAYAVAFPYFLRITLSTFPVALRELVREAWIPTYALAAALALGLVGVRLVVPLQHVPEVLLACAGGVVAYWTAFYAVCLHPDERQLVKSVLRVPRRQPSQPTVQPTPPA